MKHWDGRDPAGAELRQARHDEARLRHALRGAARRQPTQVHSLIGLAIALTVLALLSWALSPVEPVSSSLGN